MTDEIKVLAEWVSPTCTDPQMSPNMLCFLFWKWLQHWLVSWDFGCSGLGDVLSRRLQFSGQLSLIGFRLLVVLPPLEWKHMSDPLMVSLWCSWINMGFGVPRPGFRKVYTLPLIICVNLGKSPNLLKPILSVKNNCNLKKEW